MNLVFDGLAQSRSIDGFLRKNCELLVVVLDDEQMLLVPSVGDTLAVQFNHGIMFVWK